MESQAASQSVHSVGRGLTRGGLGCLSSPAHSCPSLQFARTNFKAASEASGQSPETQTSLL